MDENKKVAVDYLEWLQSSACAALGVSAVGLPSFSPEQLQEFARRAYEKLPKATMSFDEFHSSLKAHYAEMAKNAPSQFQNPQTYRLIMTLCEEVEEAISAVGLNLPTKPVFGTLYTGRVNGMAVYVPNSSYPLVLLEDGLFGFANLMAKAVVQTFVFKGEEGKNLSFSSAPEECVRRIKSQPEILNRFLDVLIAYLVAGNPHAARQYFMDFSYDGLLDCLRGSMETFIVAHEYGHLIHGHLSPERMHRGMLSDEAIDEFRPSWEDEIEADITGLQLTLTARQKKGFDISLCFWGPDLFFGCIDTVEKGVAILRSGSAEVGLSATHPPTTLRREALRRVLQNSLTKEQAAGPIQLASSVEAVIGEFWVSAEKVLSRMYQDGVELAPMWRA